MVSRLTGARGVVPLTVLLSTACVAVITFAVLDGTALTDDETAYAIQAGIYARGRITLDLPRHATLFENAFVFCNRARNRLKILYWEEGGYWLLHKRLERGRFAWPDGESPVIKLSATQLHVLLGGLDLRGVRQRRRYQRKDEAVHPTDPAVA